MKYYLKVYLREMGSAQNAMMMRTTLTARLAENPYAVHMIGVITSVLILYL